MAYTGRFGVKDLGCLERSPFWGVPIVSVIVFWHLCWYPLFREMPVFGFHRAYLISGGVVVFNCRGKAVLCVYIGLSDFETPLSAP